MPPQHEASIPARTSIDGTPHPPSYWAIVLRILELGVMAARTLLSDSHGETVARICNYIGRPYTFRADGFLGLAEPVVHVTGSDGKAVGSSLATDSGLSVSGQPDTSTSPESSDLRPEPVQDLMAGLCASIHSAMPMAKDAELSPCTTMCMPNRWVAR